MKKICTLILLCIIVFTIKGENNIETYQIISDSHVGGVDDVHIIRKINGGTVIIPEFGESCPEAMKAPFSYACKILEEYMPPCMPIKIKVDVKRINGSQQNVISKVVYKTKENFGSTQYRNSPMSMIKGVILAELGYNSIISYLQYVPSIDFLMEDYDIEITYNSLLMDELSFSLDPEPGNKFDFISLVLRDLLKGLGVSSSYRINPLDNKSLLKPTNELNPFEHSIASVLGFNEDPKSLYEKATNGELLLNNTNGLKLYAPTNWENGISLNYFIPKEDCSVSKVLSYNFGKGTVARNLSDDYSSTFFTTLLGWQPNFVTSTDGQSSSGSGSTSLLMPYNGTLTFNQNNYGYTYCPISSTKLQYDTNSSTSFVSHNDEDLVYEMYNYVMTFHPFLIEGDEDPMEGTSVSILKKDGSWDLVKFYNWQSQYMSLNMSDLNFHYENEDYSRTIDGYLRARVTIKKHEGRRTIYNSSYFVIDYLPQKVKLSYKKLLVDSTPNSTFPQNNISNEVTPVRIYFSDTEGVSNIVLERLRQGARIPTKIAISDIGKGYYDLDIDCNTTITAISYNANGSSRSLPLEILIDSKDSSFKMEINGDYINIIGLSPLKNYSLNYTLFSYNLNRSILDRMPLTNNKISITHLSKGLYSLILQDETSGEVTYLKFIKQ